MKSLLIFAVIIAASFGAVDWKDFRGGSVSLPTSKVEALSDNWQPVEKDKVLNIEWYSQYKDPRFLLAFDARGHLAGARVCFLQSDIDPAYLGVYRKSGLFEAGSYHGQKCYHSTVLFTAENVLKTGGRRMLANDEVALGVYFKKDGQYVKVDRDGCELARDPFDEQGCQSGYGLVFSKFGSTSKCDSLSPFYVVFDPEGTGNLIAFGWLSFSKFSPSDYKTTTFYKTLSKRNFKARFPHAPACLSSYAARGLTSVDVWLSYESGLMTSCSPGGWVDGHCQVTRQTRPSDESVSGRALEEDF